ncbi:MAG: hypothetical protein M1820_009564 [Bogoriella megaspora]|nr:MAG: hypothetical protein M1820_009564 [Bogoriella megaspora]
MPAGQNETDQVREAQSHRGQQEKQCSVSTFSLFTYLDGNTNRSQQVEASSSMVNSEAMQSVHRTWPTHPQGIYLPANVGPANGGQVASTGHTVVEGSMLERWVQEDLRSGPYNNIGAVPARDSSLRHGNSSFGNDRVPNGD